MGIICNCFRTILVGLSSLNESYPIYKLLSVQTQQSINLSEILGLCVHMYHLRRNQEWTRGDRYYSCENSSPDLHLFYSWRITMKLLIHRRKRNLVKEEKNFRFKIFKKSITFNPYRTGKSFHLFEFQILYQNILILNGFLQHRRHY